MANVNDGQHCEAHRNARSLANRRMLENRASSLFFVVCSICHMWLHSILRVARQPQLGEFRVFRSTQFQVFRFQTPTILKRVSVKSGKNDRGTKVKRFVIGSTAAAAFCGASALAADLPTKAPPAL